MTLGDVIKKYREEHNLSQRQFASKCNVSNGYISMLENGINPNTNEPIMPSIAILKEISSAMNMSLHDLLIQADDMPVNLSLELELQSSPEKDRQLIEFISLFKKLTAEQQSLIISQIKGILANQDQPEKTYVLKRAARDGGSGERVYTESELNEIKNRDDVDDMI